MAHADARLTDFGRLLVQRITELGWPPPQAAESLGVSRATGPRPTSGCAATAPGPSGPGRPILAALSLPCALPASQVHRVLAARRRRRQSPHRLGYHLGMARSTVYGSFAPWHEPARPHRPGQRSGGAVSA